MPAGNYELHANAFLRPGSPDAIYTTYSSGKAKVTSSLYLNSTSAPVHHICDDRQSTALFNDGGWGSDKQMEDGTYIPNCMVGASKYFAAGLYDSSVSATLETTGTRLRVGIRGTSSASYYWTIFDNFRLYFYGGGTTPTGIAEMNKGTNSGKTEIYDLSGRRVSVSSSSSVLQKGVYIINGRKVAVR